MSAAGDLTAADAALHAAIKMNKRDVEARLMLVTALAERAHTDEATAQLERCLALQATQGLVWLAAAMRLKDSQLPRPLVDALARRAYELRPKDPRAIALMRASHQLAS